VSPAIADMVEHETEIRALHVWPDPVNSDAASVLAASGAEDGVILIWNLQRRALIRSIQTRADSVTALQFAPDGASLFACFSDGSVRQFDVRTGQLLGKVGLDSRVLCMRTDGRSILVGDHDGSIRLLRGTPSVPQEDAPSDVGNASPDQSGSAGRTTCISSLKEVVRCQGKAGPVSSLGFVHAAGGNGPRDEAPSCQVVIASFVASRNNVGLLLLE